jgi:tripartite-type tricarboxylate transporter receptor subunit TctC
MRGSIGLWLALAVLGSPVGTLAQTSWPERNVSVIVPFPAGGASDITARLVTAKMAERLKHSFVIDNRAGANGALGAVAVKQAAPDGYTLLIGSIGVYGINPALFKDLKYDPLQDFDLLSVLVRTPNVLVAANDFPVKSVADLLDHLKKNPGKVTFASSGSGSSDHLTAELFWQKTGTSGVHVPYKGGGPAINDLVGGHVNVSFQNLGAVSQNIKAGKLKALGITSGKRNATLPDVPTMGEAGVPGLEVYSWQAAAAPKGLPPAVRAKIEAEIAAAANAPEIKSNFEGTGFEVVASNGDEFRKFLTDEIARWKLVVDTGKITPQQ